MVIVGLISKAHFGTMQYQLISESVAKIQATGFGICYTKLTMHYCLLNLPSLTLYYIKMKAH